MQSAKTYSKFRVAHLPGKSSLWPAPARAKLESWVNQYGISSTSYVLLEGPKRYFTSPHVDGFLAYQVRAGVAVIGGDPVCTRRQAAELIRDFVATMSGMTTCPVGAYQVSPDMRDAFREAFAGFDFLRVARFTDRDIERLVGNAGIVRHRGKIESTRNNARRAAEIVARHGSLAAYFWGFEPKPAQRGRLTREKLARLPTSPESIALSKDLKRQGFTFVGPTTVYAFMQAMGLVNDHVHGCAIREPVERARAAFERPRTVAR